MTPLHTQRCRLEQTMAACEQRLKEGRRCGHSLESLAAYREDLECLRGLLVILDKRIEQVTMWEKEGLAL